MSQPDKYRGRTTMQELEKELKELNINQPDPPELPGTKPPTKEYTWRDPWLQTHM